MKDRSGFGDHKTASGWVSVEMMGALNRQSILVVEDDPDIRELLVTLLEIAGYDSTACATAEAGLEALREATFDFVLTDYALPNRTGGWLLRQAQSEGLLDATPALVVTAHPNPSDVDGFQIVHKPFDLDDLVTHVRRRLDGGRERDTGGGKSNPGSGDSGRSGGNDRDCPDPIELILYVSAESPRSANAIHNIKRVLSRYRSDKVTLTICDLAKDPALGAADSIAFTPTLVKRSPGPRTFILGHITNPEILIELLEGCDVET
jgi:CheY-like chemotaxis protein